MNTNKVIYSNGFLLNDKLSEILLPLPSHMQKNQKIKKKYIKMLCTCTLQKERLTES